MQQEIKAALDVLNAGGTILYPTDTIWGIGCDATNEKAVEKIFKIKQRSESKSLIVLVNHTGMLERYTKDVPDVAWDLVELAEDPLTVIYPKSFGIAKNVISEDGSVGIRVVKDTFCEQLITRFKKPIVSTSANISGKASPVSFRDIDPLILQQVDYVVNLRQNETNPAKPSAIIKLGLKGEVEVIRK